MHTTVIVPTYNGAEKIGHLLKALLKQSMADFELIVVVDGSSDNTEQVLNEYTKQFAQIRIINQINSGRAIVRNRGAQEASHDLLVFYDDDMVPLPDSVERHIKFHNEVKEKSILTGYTPQAVENEAYDFERYRAFLSAKWMKHFPDEIYKMNKADLFLTAANFSIRKSLFFDLNGFNVDLKDGEDKDLGRRAFENGVNLFFDKKNVAFHREQINCRLYIFRLREYALAEKSIQILPDGPESTLEISNWRKGFYFVMASPLIVRIIDSNFLTKILPLKLRYKIYDAVTFSLSKVHPEVEI